LLFAESFLDGHKASRGNSAGLELAFDEGDDLTARAVEQGKGGTVGKRPGLEDAIAYCALSRRRNSRPADGVMNQWSLPCIIQLSSIESTAMELWSLVCRRTASACSSAAPIMNFGLPTSGMMVKKQRPRLTAPLSL
jgi:hypothetical protein